MSSAPEQLLLRVLPPGEQAFDNFCGRGNAEAHARLRALAADVATPGARIWLTGGGGCGKSHLLRAALREAERAGHCARLELAASFATEQGREQHDEPVRRLWLIDDVDAIAGDGRAEAALMQLWNESGGGLVFASRLHPDACAWQLPDLRSRLLASEIFRLVPPDDDDLRALVVARAAAVGLLLDDEVVAYLLRRLPRDPRSVSHAVDQLDLASWRQRRRITLPLVRDVLGIGR